MNDFFYISIKENLEIWVRKRAGTLFCQTASPKTSLLVETWLLSSQFCVRWCWTHVHSISFEFLPLRIFAFLRTCAAYLHVGTNPPSPSFLLEFPRRRAFVAEPEWSSATTHNRIITYGNLAAFRKGDISTAFLLQTRLDAENRMYFAHAALSRLSVWSHLEMALSSRAKRFDFAWKRDQGNSFLLKTGVTDRRRYELKRMFSVEAKFSSRCEQNEKREYGIL